jgi:hypothetical protein
MSAEAGEIRIYARAEGCGMPPLLLTPPPEWTVAVFTRVALSTLRADSSLDRVPCLMRTGETLPVDGRLAELPIKPYDCVEFRLHGT